MDTNEASTSEARNRNHHDDDDDMAASPVAKEIAAVLDDMIERRLKIVARDSAAFAGSSTSEPEDTGIRLFKLSRRLLKSDEDDQTNENGKMTGQTNCSARKKFIRKRKRCNSSSDESSDDGNAKLRASAVTSDWVMKSAGFSTVIK